MKESLLSFFIAKLRQYEGAAGATTGTYMYVCYYHVCSTSIGTFVIVYKVYYNSEMNLLCCIFVLGYNLITS